MDIMNSPSAADYETLGLSPGATQTEVKAAYKKLCAKVHPDVGGTDSLFRQVSEAYKNIIDGGTYSPKEEPATYEPWDPFASVKKNWNSQTENNSTDDNQDTYDVFRDRNPSKKKEHRPMKIWSIPFLAGSAPTTSLGSFLLFAAALFISILAATSNIVEPVRGVLSILPVVLAVGRIASTPKRLR